MYQPAYFKETDKSEASNFIEAHPFGTLISKSPFIASHLAMMISEDGSRIYTHVSARNELASLEPESEVMAIFQGPHAYISPKHYNSSESVPTWNYIAVHVKGRVVALEKEKSEEVLVHLIDHMEPEYRSKWNIISEQYRSALIKEMCPIEIEITSIEMAKKLSQNKSRTERGRIADYLLSMENSNSRELAVEMKKGL